MLSNIFLKFSRLAILKDDDYSISNNHTAAAILIS